MLKTIVHDYCRYIVLALACLCIGCYIGYHLHDYGSGNGSAGQQIESAIRANESHEASVDRITSGADRVESRIDEAQNGISKAEAGTRSSEQLTRECQQILAGIRARGNSHPSQN